MGMDTPAAILALGCKGNVDQSIHRSIAIASGYVQRPHRVAQGQTAAIEFFAMGQFR